MSHLEQIHEEAIEALKNKYGEEKVDWVNSLNPDITMAVMEGQRFDWMPQWAADIVQDFEELIITNPLSGCKIH